MSLRFLLDEDSLGPLWTALQRLEIRQGVPLDVLAVGQEGAPPLGTKDPDLLVWLERHGRILVTNDKSSMPVHLADHLSTGKQVPGIFAIRRGASIQDVIEFITLATEFDEAGDWVDRLTYIP